MRTLEYTPTQNISGLPSIDDILNIVIPKQPLPFVIGGSALVAIGSMEKFGGTLTRPVLLSVGGIALGLGLLPLIMKLVK